jgi:hypothetical protein
MVRVPGYKSRDPGSIPGTIRFTVKYWVWTGPLSLVIMIGELLEIKK